MTNRNKKPKLVVVSTVQGELTANIIKSHLETEGIPVMLKYEAFGRVSGLTINGLGQVKIMVPEEFAEDARQVIAPQERDTYNS